MTVSQVAGAVQFDPLLRDFIETEVLPGLALDRPRFWSAFEKIVADFTPRNAALLAERDRLHALIQARHAGLQGKAPSSAEEESFLREIGYLHATPAAFQIETRDVDDELAKLSAPQLVVPIDNARYALNAANARWGSLYDALYGTNVIPGERGAGGYDPTRGDQVVAWVRSLLDEIFPLAGGSHADVAAYTVSGGRLATDRGGLKAPEQFAGFAGSAEAPTSIVLRNNGLHLEIRIQAGHPIGVRDKAGVADVLLESAGSKSPT